MAAELVLLFAALLAVGALTQWVAWRFTLPPILLLVIGGLLAGPATGWLNPDAALGDLLLPLVSLGVAIILFEGGMTLRWRELRGVGRTVLLLVSAGVLITWVIGTWAAHFIAGVPLGAAYLLGAILTVSGPTVIGPLLTHIRPQGAVASILKWEGIVIDPIGALLAVVVFLAVSVGDPGQATAVVAGAAVRGIIMGLLWGLGAALLLTLALARYWVPDHLQNSVALALVVVAFAGANWFQNEAGLVAVTVMGIAMANQRWAPIREILEFKETLRVLIIPALFILLTARITRADVAFIGPEHLLFLAILILVARPISVLVSTMGAPLGIRERVFLASLMPRGIVAAAVASVLALELEEHAVPGSEALVPMTFLVIIGTVLVYSIVGAPLARALGLARQGTGGILIIGAAPFARQLAATLSEEDVEVVVVDTNRGNITETNVLDVASIHLDALSEEAEETLHLERIDHVLALTPNDRVNQLAALRYAKHVGRAEVFRLASGGRGPRSTALMSGRVLFHDEATWVTLNARVAAGHYIVRTPLTERFGIDDWRAHHGPEALPLLLVRASGSIDVYATDVRPEALPGDTLFGLVADARPAGDAAGNGK